MRGLRRLGVALVVVMGASAALALVSGMGPSSSPAVASVGQPAMPAAPATPAIVPVQAKESTLQATAVPIPGMSDDMVLGDPKAPITIIEYSALTCPHCASFHRDTLPKIKKEWIETGKAKIVYRDFPFEGVGMGAAMLARCTSTDRYFGFLETLFATQTQWAYSKNPLAGLQSLAKLAGIDDERFKACLSDQKLMAGIKAKQKEGEEKYKINSTPTFVVNGKVIVGAVPYEQFEAALKAAQ